MSASFRLLLAPLFFVLISLVSCTDSDVNVTNDSIIGEWQHTERAFSTGAELIVEDVIRGEVYRINDDGTFTYVFEEESTGTWEITADDVLSFNFDIDTEGRIVDFSYEIDGDALILKPAFVFCAEECFNKYKRR